MEKKTTLSIYRSDEGFDQDDLSKLADALSEHMDCELKIINEVTPDGEEIMFVLGE